MITIDELKMQMGDHRQATAELGDALAITASEKRVAELERAQQPAKEPVPLAKTSAAPAAPSDAPAVFPARTEEVVTWPRCGRRQKGNRDSCYACGLPFRYEQE